MILLVATVFAADAAREAEATRMLGRASSAWEQGQMESARQELQDLLANYSDTAAARVALAGAVAPQSLVEGAATTAPPSDADPERARALLGEVMDAINTADYPLARSLLAQYEASFPDLVNEGKTSRARKELSVVDRVAPALSVEKWYQGRATLGDQEATLLLFFETWCPHCRNEAPKAEVLWKAYGERMQVIGLTRLTKSSTDAAVGEFIAEHGLTFPIAKEGGSMSEAYEVTGIPAAAIVRNGTVIWRGHPARLTDELVIRLLR